MGQYPGEKKTEQNMFHALNRIGIIKRTTEHLSRQRAARAIVPSQSHQLQKTSEVPNPRLALEDEDYLLVDIKDDGTAEASRVDPGCRVGLVLVVSHSQKALDLKGAAGKIDAHFEDVPL